MVTSISLGVALIRVLKRRRGDVIGSSPHKHLLLTMLSSSLGLVETLKSAIVSLIESPMLVDGDIVLTELSDDGVVGYNGS